MTRVFIDSDVLLDHLANRQPFQKEATQSLSLAWSGKLAAYTSPLVVANVHYVLRRFGTSEDALIAIGNLLSYIVIIPINETIVKVALKSPFADFEDALQHEAAIHSGKVEAILTRNLKDYKKSSLPVMTPATFLHSHTTP